jgi:hypothetical protein
VPRSIGVGSWFEDTSMGALYVGMLGKAQSSSMRTEGTEALPRWDPSTGCPRLALNTNYGVPLNL